MAKDQNLRPMMHPLILPMIYPSKFINSEKSRPVHPVHKLHQRSPWSSRYFAPSHLHERSTNCGRSSKAAWIKAMLPAMLPYQNISNSVKYLGFLWISWMVDHVHPIILKKKGTFQPEPHGGPGILDSRLSGLDCKNQKNGEI